ncbi:MAG: hypothetical protein EWV82_03240 [Microcystis aeruginosa Ma_AC_P_19900807_S299]|nr:MAG: hypothetical protein EWV82_03240 [Microcystis aeruginosa Ma_AC_P_19900807_S299]
MTDNKELMKKLEEVANGLQYILDNFLYVELGFNSIEEVPNIYKDKVDQALKHFGNSCEEFKHFSETVIELKSMVNAETELSKKGIPLAQYIKEQNNLRNRYDPARERRLMKGEFDD